MRKYKIVSKNTFPFVVNMRTRPCISKISNIYEKVEARCITIKKNICNNKLSKRFVKKRCNLLLHFLILISVAYSCKPIRHATSH